MTKQEIIDYIMTTPSNPNKAVLEGMLDSIDNAGGEADPNLNYFTIDGTHAYFNSVGNYMPITSMVLSPNVKTLQAGCFNGQTKMKRFVGEGLTAVADGAFNTTGLEYAYIGKNVSSIGSRAFEQTPDTLVLDCGFPEGQVSGAPWGATNATINYNVPAPRDI